MQEIDKIIKNNPDFSCFVRDAISSGEYVNEEQLLEEIVKAGISTIRNTAKHKRIALGEVLASLPVFSDKEAEDFARDIEEGRKLFQIQLKPWE